LNDFQLRKARYEISIIVDIVNFNQLSKSFTPSNTPSKMATPSAQPPNPPSSTGMDDESRAKLVHNVSLAALIVCPLVMALPPRKFDIYTGLLMTGTFLGGNQLAYEYTGRSFVARCQARIQAIQSLGTGEGSLPEKAKIMQARLREERERREKMQGVYANPVGEKAQVTEVGVLDEVRRRQEEDERERKERGLIGKLWLGGEGEDWKAKRDQKEKEALEEGKGYGDLIMDQIWEVWSWGKDKVEDIKEKDEEVVREKKEHQPEGTRK
jgi:hypothetical protein